MEPTEEKSQKANLALPIVIAALVVFAAIGFYLYQSSSSKNASPTNNSVTQTPSTNTTQVTTTPTTTTTVEYMDGTFEGVGNYVSPGGPREVTVTITLSGGKVSDSTFVAKEADATSKRFQKEFADNYKAMIVGKSLDEVKLTKVSGSSLTPKGFTDALEKIKTEAKKS